jgi:ABC-2 type transport system ATP-binding protein
METADRLCDDILLMNKARKVLAGSLREVKAQAGTNLIALRATGARAVLSDTSMVAEVIEHADESQIRPAKGVDPQMLLRRLVDSGAEITKFEQVEPSLSDIFIERVTESNA